MAKCRLTLGLVAIALMGCQGQSSTDDLEQLTLTTAETYLPSQSPLPTVETTPYPTNDELPPESGALLPTPAFPESLVAQSLLLSTGISVTCTLPCWHDLRIGESSQQDVQQVLTDVLDSEEGFDFFSIPAGITSLWVDPLPTTGGQLAGGYQWNFFDPDEGGGVYYLYAVLDTDTKLLYEIIEGMSVYGFFEVPSLEEIANRLGRPSWILIGPLGGTQGVGLYYEKGIHIFLTLSGERIDSTTEMLCLDQDPLTLNISIVAPYHQVSDLNLSPVEREWIENRSEYYVEEKLNMSIDEFINFLQTDSPCIEVPR